MEGRQRSNIWWLVNSKEIRCLKTQVEEIVKSIELKIVANSMTDIGGDGATASYEVECVLVGPSIPWNMGYSSCKTLETSIADLTLRLNITLKEDGEIDIEWLGDGKYPISDVCLDTSEIDDEIESVTTELKDSLERYYD